MKWIGITGGIASGKSTVTKYIQDLGGVVVDADKLAREVVEKDSFGLRALVQNFDAEILLPSKELDRSKLGKIIFQDEKARLLVEKITHPLIQWRALQEKRFLESQGLPCAFYDAALIFEKGLQNGFDAVIVVNASADIQRKRLMERNKISAAEASKRMSSQMPLDKKVVQAQYVIDNDGDFKNTKRQVEEIYKKILEAKDGTR